MIGEREWRHTYHQDKLADGTWACYSYERIDDRDIMNDTWYPNWKHTGRYMVDIMMPGTRNSSDCSMTIITDKKCGNLISKHMSIGKYKTYGELLGFLLAVMKRCGDYRFSNGKHHGTITEELYNKEASA